MLNVNCVFHLLEGAPVEIAFDVQAVPSVGDFVSFPITSSKSSWVVEAVTFELGTTDIIIELV